MIQFTMTFWIVLKSFQLKRKSWNRLKYMNSIYILYILILSILPLYLSANVGTTSMAMGILIFSILVYIGSIKYWNCLYHIKKKFIFFIVSFLFYLICVIFFTNDLLNIKAYLSLIILLFIFGAAYLTAYSLSSTNDFILYKVVRNTFFIFMFLGLYQIVFIGGARHILLFGEASHYALFIGPFSIALYVLTQSKFLKLFIILWLFLAGISFPNTTILVYAFLILLLHVKFNIKSIILLVIGGAILVNLIFTNEYFYQRIFFWNNQSSKNLSSLVYLQGIEDAYYSITSTNGFGIGFQQMGAQKSSEAGLRIQEIMGNETGLNRQDGGFTAAKIIAELGYFGIILLVFFFIIAKKSYVYLSYFVYSKVCDIPLVISYSFIYAYLVELFVRGAGYFTQSSFLFYVAVSYLLIMRKNEPPNNPQ